MGVMPTNEIRTATLTAPTVLRFDEDYDETMVAEIGTRVQVLVSIAGHSIISIGNYSADVPDTILAVEVRS